MLQLGERAVEGLLARATGRESRKWFIAGASGAAVATTFAVSILSTGRGVPFSDAIVAAALAALLVLYPRLLVGTVVGIGLAAAFGTGGSAWEMWKEGFYYVWYSSLAGIALYHSGKIVRFLGAAPRVLRAEGPSVVRELIDIGRDHLGSPVRAEPLADVDLGRFSSLTDDEIDLQAVLVLGSALLFAFARLATDRFYGHFGVTAEEVSIGTPSLLLSAALAVFVVLGIVVVGGVTLRALIRLKVPRLLVFLIGATALWYADPPVNIAELGVVLGFIFIGWFFTANWDGWTGRIGWRWGVFSTIVFAVMVLGVAIDGSDRAIDGVESGVAYQPRLGPLLFTPLHAPTVEVWPVGGYVLPATMAEEPCVSLLGVGQGLTVLAAEDLIWRVPTEQVALKATECVHR